MDHLNETALLLWQSRKSKRAKTLFEKLITRDCVSLQDTTIAQYMLAYLACEYANEQYTDLSDMGIDLMKGFHGLYSKAGKHIAALREFNFNPQTFGLPLFDTMSLARIVLAHPRAALFILSNPLLKSLLTPPAFELIESINPALAATSSYKD